MNFIFSTFFVQLYILNVFFTLYLTEAPAENQRPSVIVQAPEENQEKIDPELEEVLDGQLDKMDNQKENYSESGYINVVDSEDETDVDKSKNIFDFDEKNIFFEPKRFFDNKIDL